MLEAIADTSPLQYLHQVHCLDLLPKLYATVLVPGQARKELQAGMALGVDLPEVHARSWIRLLGETDGEFLPTAAGLGAGEREVLRWTLETPGTVAILDDGLARRYAQQLNLRFTGTLGVLLRGKREGYLPRIAPVLDRLENRGFRLASKTRAGVLQLARENGPGDQP